MGTERGAILALPSRSRYPALVSLQPARRGPGQSAPSIAFASARRICQAQKGPPLRSSYRVQAALVLDACLCVSSVDSRWAAASLLHRPHAQNSLFPRCQSSAHVRLRASIRAAVHPTNAWLRRASPFLTISPRQALREGAEGVWHLLCCAVLWCCCCCCCCCCSDRRCRRIAKLRLLRHFNTTTTTTSSTTSSASTAYLVPPNFLNSHPSFISLLPCRLSPPTLHRWPSRRSTSPL